jgi:hypothetical protein
MAAILREATPTHLDQLFLFLKEQDAAGNLEQALKDVDELVARALYVTLLGPELIIPREKFEAVVDLVRVETRTPIRPNPAALQFDLPRVLRSLAIVDRVLEGRNFLNQIGGGGE